MSEVGFRESEDPYNILFVRHPDNTIYVNTVWRDIQIKRLVDYGYSESESRNIVDRYIEELIPDALEHEVGHLAAFETAPEFPYDASDQLHRGAFLERTNSAIDRARRKTFE